MDMKSFATARAAVSNHGYCHTMALLNHCCNSGRAFSFSIVVVVVVVVVVMVSTFGTMCPAPLTVRKVRGGPSVAYSSK